MQALVCSREIQLYPNRRARETEQGLKGRAGLECQLCVFQVPMNDKGQTLSKYDEGQLCKIVLPELEKQHMPQ